MIQKIIKKILFVFLLPISMMAQNLQPLTLAGHKAGVNVCSFSPDGKRLISGSKDGAVKVWDVAQNYKMIKEFSFGDDAITALHYNHKGDKISIGSLECLQLYNSSTFKRINRKKKAHVTFVKSGNFSPDDQFIVSSSWKENALVIWESATLKQVLELGEHSWTDEAGFTPDGNYIISCNHDNNAKVWDSKTGNLIRTFAGHTDWVYSVKITSDMKTLFTGSFDQTVKGWDFKSGKLLYTLAGHKDGITSIALSPDNQFIVSASVDGALILWDLTTQKEKFRFSESGASILQLAFSPDGKSLVSCNIDGNLLVWTLPELK
jgi:WD40 repeat protein